MENSPLGEKAIKLFDKYDLDAQIKAYKELKDNLSTKLVDEAQKHEDHQNKLLKEKDTL